MPTAVPVGRSGVGSMSPPLPLPFRPPRLPRFLLADTSAGDAFLSGSGFSCLEPAEAELGATAFGCFGANVSSVAGLPRGGIVLAASADAASTP